MGTMRHRYMYENFLAESGVVFSPSSTKAGVVTGAIPLVANGSGSVIFSGAYTGESISTYVIEIDLAGDVATATFKWKKSGSVGWEASGLPTALTDTLLDSGVSVKFAIGTGTDFSLGDRWATTASRFRSGDKIADYDPSSKWRSVAPPEDPDFLALDLLTAHAPDALALLHNISSAATIKIQGGPVPQKSCVEFDGLSGSVTVANHASQENPFDGGGSISFWIYLRSKGESNNTGMISKSPIASPGWYFLGGTPNATSTKLTFVYFFSGSNLSFTTTNREIVFNTWNYVVVTYNADAVANDPIIYVNGSAVALTDDLGNPVGTRTTDAASSYIIGSDAADGRTADGFMDEVRVYKGRILTPAEVLEQYAGTYTDETSLVMHLRLDEGTGSVAADSSSIGNDGALTGNAAWSTSVYSPVEETLAYNAKKIAHYFATSPRSYRYWRLLITGDAANSDGFLEVGELLLGPYFEPSRMWDVGTSYGDRFFETNLKTDQARDVSGLRNKGKRIILPYRDRTEDERLLFETMIETIKDPDNPRKTLPFFVHVDTSKPAKLHFVNLLGGFEAVMNGNYRHDFGLEMEEQL